MKKTKHQKFLEELRAPVLNADKAQHFRKTSGPHPVNVIETRRNLPPERPDAFDINLNDNNDLMAELEAKFEALFGGADDDDD